MGRYVSGVRKRIWENGKEAKPRDIAEAVRDLDSSVTSIYTRKIVKSPNTVYIIPFTIPYDHLPDGVLCINARISQAPEAATAAGGIVAWVWTGSDIRVVNIPGCTTNLAYDFTFEIIG